MTDLSHHFVLTMPSGEQIKLQNFLNIWTLRRCYKKVQSGYGDREAFVDMIFSRAVRQDQDVYDFLHCMDDHALQSLGECYIEKSYMSHFYRKTDPSQSFFTRFVQVLDMQARQWVMELLTEPLGQVIRRIDVDMQDVFRYLQYQTSRIGVLLARQPDVERLHPPVRSKGNDSAWSPKMAETHISDLAQTLDSSLRDTVELEQRFSVIIVKLGWPPHEGLDSHDISHIVEAYDSFGYEAVQQHIDDFFLTRYSETVLHEMVEAWGQQGWLGKRMTILREAVQAHLEARYCLAIPTMLPQIEGLVYDAFGHTGRVREWVFAEYVKRLLERKRVISFDSAMQFFLLEIVRANFEDYSLGSPSFLSRHAILHGSDTEYGSATNSLKCILLFDYLQSRFRLVSFGNERYYHLFSCPFVVQRTSSKRTFYRDAAEAASQGKKPCKICKPHSLNE